MLVPYHVLENEVAVAVHDRTTCDEEFITRSDQVSVDEPLAVHVTDSRIGTNDDLDWRGEKIFGSPIEYAAVLMAGTLAYRYLPGHAV